MMEPSANVIFEALTRLAVGASRDRDRCGVEMQALAFSREASINRRKRGRLRPFDVGHDERWRKGYAAVRVFECDPDRPSSSAHARGAAGSEMGRELGRVRAWPLPGR